MAKDFAKKSKKRNSASRLDSKNTTAAIPGWIWMVAGLLLGISIGVYVYIQYENSTKIKPVRKIEKLAPSAKSRYKAVPAEETNNSEFDYHHILDKKTVDVPVEQSKPISSRTVKSYIMQCGSFRKEASADSLKAQIALNGFEAVIKATDEKSGKRWYRVTLGPYNSKRLAESDRHQLERNNINNCRIW